MKIISGGQTGVDLAALDFASVHGFRYGGWVPKGRTNEAGRIPDRFGGLVEAESAEPAQRTRLNVGSADATLILNDGADSPGTVFTAHMAVMFGTPLLQVDLRQEQAQKLKDWLQEFAPVVLNIAGPRESESPGIGERAGLFLCKALLWSA